MEYKKILKRRMYRGAVILALGALCFVMEFINPSEGDVLLVLGFAMCGYGIASIIQSLWKSRSDEAIYRNSIEETDERNRMLWGHAKCKAMDIYIYACAAAIIVFRYLEWYDMAAVLGYSLCALAAIYVVTYYIMRRKY